MRNVKLGLRGFGTCLYVGSLGVGENSRKGGFLFSSSWRKASTLDVTIYVARDGIVFVPDKDIANLKKVAAAAAIATVVVSGAVGLVGAATVLAADKIYNAASDTSFISDVQSILNYLKKDLDDVIVVPDVNSAIITINKRNFDIWSMSAEHRQIKLRGHVSVFGSQIQDENLWWIDIESDKKLMELFSTIGIPTSVNTKWVEEGVADLVSMMNK